MRPRKRLRSAGWLPAIALIAVACAGDAASSGVNGSGSKESRTGATPELDRPLAVDSAALARARTRATELTRLRSLLVAHEGERVAEWYFGGADADDAANLKSVSKAVLSALVGIAIDEGTLQGVDQKVAPFFAGQLPDPPDPRWERVTIEHLLTQRSGLESTSFGNYGRWVTSRDWVRHVVTRPFEAEPGGRMIYSTGNSHLLSAILTQAAGTSIWAYARQRLAEPLGVDLPRWQRDPQGIYFGGNNMRLTPRAMLRFGELYRNGGRYEGRQVVPRHWVWASWRPRTMSRWNRYRHGYGWWVRTVRGRRVNFAWGYGGQFIFVIPSLELTVVMTSDPTNAARGYRSQLFSLLAEHVMTALRPVESTAEAAAVAGPSP